MVWLFYGREHRRGAQYPRRLPPHNRAASVSRKDGVARWAHNIPESQRPRGLAGRLNRFFLRRPGRPLSSPPCGPPRGFTRGAAAHLRRLMPLTSARPGRNLADGATIERGGTWEYGNCKTTERVVCETHFSVRGGGSSCVSQSSVRALLASTLQ